MSNFVKFFCLKKLKIFAEFIKFVLSKQGQAVVVKDGFGALPLKAADAELKKVQ